MAAEDRIGRDVEAAVQQVRELLDRLVSMDPLTGLGHSRAFSARLEAGPGELPWGLVAVEINGFKAINSAYGHSRTDLVLREIAVRISDAVGDRAEAQAFRLGGDEFAVLLPDDDHEGLAALGDAVRRSVAAQPFTLPGGVETRPEEVTVVVGCVSADHPPELRQLLRDELDALTEYQKHMGLADRVVCLWQVAAEPDYVAFAEGGRPAPRSRFHCPTCRSRGYATLTPQATQCPRCRAYFGARLA